MKPSVLLLGLLFVVVGLLFLMAARYWWRKVIGLNRRLFGAPGSESGRGLEQLNRTMGAVFVGVLGAVLIVSGAVWIVLGLVRG